LQGRTLGHGTYSVVKEAVHIQTGKQYATKVISKRLMKGREHMVKNEIVVLKRISQGHKNILTLVDYFETPNNLYLVTDLARGNELFDRIYHKGSFYESDAANIIRSIASGVAYLHSHGIVHRDLKPENLLFQTPDEDSDLLIADFGLSRIIDEEKFRMLTTTCGTPAYMAPEIFKKSGHGKPVDVWAIGVITYFLLCGYTPFDRDSSAEEMQAILACDYSFEPEEYWQDVSEDARDFISKCLQIDVDKRITAEECLKHPFLREREKKPVSEAPESAAESAETKSKDDDAVKNNAEETNGDETENGEAAETTEVGEDGVAKPKKRETDLLPTVKSNLNLRGRITPSGSVDKLTNLSMTPATPAPVPSAAAPKSSDSSTSTMEGAFSQSPDVAKPLLTPLTPVNKTKD